MRSNSAIGEALRLLREAKGLTQEDFGIASSRTYVSTIERGLKSPTLGKIEQLASVLVVHPLSLIALAYADSASNSDVEEILALVRHELRLLIGGGNRR